jgi:hypothetical protein
MFACPSLQLLFELVDKFHETNVSVMPLKATYTVKCSQ